MMKKEKNLTLIYALIQWFFWMNFAAILGFASVYLLDAGLTNTQIGMVIAIAGAICSVLQPVVASYADKPKSPSLKKILILWNVLLLLFSALLIVLPKNVLVAGVLFGANMTFFQQLLPLVNSLGMETLNQKKKMNFGLARGMGSASYAVTSYILGIAAAKLGAVSVPAAMMLGFAMEIVFLMIFPFEKTASPDTKKKAKNSGGFLYFIRKYKQFTLVLCGCICVYIGHVLINNFTFQIVESKGGGSSEMGVAMFLAAIVELPTMFFFGAMLKKARADIWFRMSGIFLTLKVLGSLLAPNMPVFYIVQVCQMLGWGLISVSSVYYVNSIMEEQDAIKGQAYITMTFTLASVLGASIGGALIDLAGVSMMLLFATICSVIGMIIIMGAARPAKKAA